MQFGLALGSAASGPDASSARIRELALAAESLGLHSVWVPDHVVLPVGATSPFPYAGPGVTFEIERHGVTYDPMATLPYLAGLTHRVRLGVSVLVVPYRNPLVVAKWLASLDQLSGGRVLVGVGVGWLAEEFAALGQPQFTARGALSDEYLAYGRQPGRDARQDSRVTIALVPFSPGPGRSSGPIPRSTWAATAGPPSSASCAWAQAGI